jgi:hypothetical protein
MPPRLRTDPQPADSAAAAAHGSTQPDPLYSRAVPFSADLTNSHSTK